MTTIQAMKTGTFRRQVWLACMLASLLLMQSAFYSSSHYSWSWLTPRNTRGAIPVVPKEDQTLSFLIIDETESDPTPPEHATHEAAAAQRARDLTSDPLPDENTPYREGDTKFVMHQNIGRLDAGGPAISKPSPAQAEQPASRATPLAKPATPPTQPPVPEQPQPMPETPKPLTPKEPREPANPLETAPPAPKPDMSKMPDESITKTAPEITPEPSDIPLKKADPTPEKPAEPSPDTSPPKLARAPEPAATPAETTPAVTKPTPPVKRTPPSPTSEAVRETPPSPPQVKRPPSPARPNFQNIGTAAGREGATPTASATSSARLTGDLAYETLKARYPEYMEIIEKKLHRSLSAQQSIQKRSYHVGIIYLAIGIGVDGQLTKLSIISARDEMAEEQSLSLTAIRNAAPFPPLDEEMQKDIAIFSDMGIRVGF